jgi:DNA-directed RNA polymerase specialized sigma24 family protein
MPEPAAHVLQQHAQSLRELARALVGGSNSDDILQEAAVVALAHPTPLRQPLAFLRHVVRIHAVRWRRGELRRRRREHRVAAAAEIAAAPPELALAQRETVARLHAALLAVHSHSSARCCCATSRTCRPRRSRRGWDCRSAR